MEVIIRVKDAGGINKERERLSKLVRLSLERRGASRLAVHATSVWLEIRSAALATAPNPSRGKAAALPDRGGPAAWFTLALRYFP